MKRDLVGATREMESKGKVPEKKSISRQGGSARRDGRKHHRRGTLKTRLQWGRATISFMVGLVSD